MAVPLPVFLFGATEAQFGGRIRSGRIQHAEVLLTSDSVGRSR
jgi:hypothetical protein